VSSCLRRFEYKDLNPFSIPKGLPGIDGSGVFGLDWEVCLVAGEKRRLKGKMGLGWLLVLRGLW
jgi:hypothetical protein